MENRMVERPTRHTRGHQGRPVWRPLRSLEGPGQEKCYPCGPGGLPVGLPALLAKRMLGNKMGKRWARWGTRGKLGGS